MSEAWSAVHGAFHAALVRGGDSPWLLRLREPPYVQGKHYRRLSVPISGVTRDFGREHRDIMDAVPASDSIICGSPRRRRRRVQFTTLTTMINELTRVARVNQLSRPLGRWDRLHPICMGWDTCRWLKPHGS